MSFTIFYRSVHQVTSRTSGPQRFFQTEPEHLPSAESLESLLGCLQPGETCPKEPQMVLLLPWPDPHRLAQPADASDEAALNPNDALWMYENVRDKIQADQVSLRDALSSLRIDRSTFRRKRFVRGYDWRFWVPHPSWRSESSRHKVYVKRQLLETSEQRGVGGCLSMVN